MKVETLGTKSCLENAKIRNVHQFMIHLCQFEQPQSFIFISKLIYYSRGLSRESTRTLTQETAFSSGCDIIDNYPTRPVYPPSTLSSHHSLLSFSNPEYDSTEGFHSSGISSADSWAQDDVSKRISTAILVLKVLLEGL